MPAIEALPTLEDYRQAFHSAVRGRRDKRADGRSGSVYDFVAGTSAMLLARDSAYLRDVFRAIYEADAAGDDLTALIAGRYNIARITDGFGQGTATLRRSSAAADAGLGQAVRTIYEGTRILVQGANATATPYAVAADTPVPSGVLTVAGLPIRATTYGAGVALDTTLGRQPCRLDDPLWDPSWTVTSLRCQDGTTYERAADFRARVGTLLTASRVGYVPAMVAACTAAGAANVTVFGTNFGGVDLRACAVYVGDANFTGTTALVRASAVALESARMLGAELILESMAPQALTLAVQVQLYADPSTFAVDTIAASCEAALRRAFGASASYGYDLDALRGALVNVSDAIQDATFTSPASSVGLLVNGFFPGQLPRYAIPATGVALTFVGPS